MSDVPDLVANLRASLKEAKQRREAAVEKEPSAKAEPQAHRPWCVLLDDECDCYWV